jgi:hypothetical protein
LRIVSVKDVVPWKPAGIRAKIIDQFAPAPLRGYSQRRLAAGGRGFHQFYFIAWVKLEAPHQGRRQTNRETISPLCDLHLPSGYP